MSGSKPASAKVKQEIESEARDQRVIDSVADTGWSGGRGVRCRFAIQCFTGPYCVNQPLSHTYIYEETSL